MSNDRDTKALIAITMDLEMCRNFPTWDQTEWDYQKGNVDADTREYALEAARRVAEAGGRIHFFALGRTLEQGDIDWLKALSEAGHPIGNHTYDHVNILATNPEDLQFRFQRAPWLIEGRHASDVIAENIRMTTKAFKMRLGIEPAGFRAPYCFERGLKDRPDLQKMLFDLNFQWVSSHYPSHPIGESGQPAEPQVLDGIVKSQADAQPFVYTSGLIEIPINPISDIFAFRNGRWKLESFLEAIRRAIEWTIDKGGVFDFLSHPACLLVTDPDFQTIELICHLVNQAGDRAVLVDLNAVAERAQALG